MTFLSVLALVRGLENCEAVLVLDLAPRLHSTESGQLHAWMLGS